jgi:hypothetical protein
MLVERSFQKKDLVVSVPDIPTREYILLIYVTSKLRRNCCDNKFKYLKNTNIIKEMAYYLACFLK